MECSITWNSLEVHDKTLWKAIIVPLGHYRTKLGPVEVSSTVHPLKLILAIESLAYGTLYLLSDDFEEMELEDEPDYTTLISSCRAFDGFYKKYKLCSTEEASNSGIFEIQTHSPRRVPHLE